MSLKKINLLSYLFIIIILSVFVLSEGIDIKLIQYDPDSTLARLQFQNQESKSLRNLTLVIDDSEPYFLVGLLPPGNAVVHARNIPQGMHKVSVTTKEGIASTAELLFSKSAQKIEEELELKKANQTKQQNAEQIIKKEESPKKKSNIGKILFFLIILLFIISAYIYWYLNLRHKRPQKKIMPTPIKAVQFQLRQKSPEQIKREFEERARKRQEMMERIMKR